MNLKELYEQLLKAEHDKTEGRYDEAQSMALVLISQCDDRCIEIHRLEPMTKSSTMHADTETDNDALDLRVRAMQLVMNIAVLQGEFRRALGVGQEIDALAGIHGLRRVQAHAWSVIGVSFKELGLFSQALEFYEKALVVHEEIQDFSILASDLQNIGNVHRHIGSYRQSLQYLEQALSLYVRLGEKRGIAAATSNIASSYYFLGEYESALDYFGQAAVLANEIANVSFEASILGNIGSVYSAMGIYDKGLENDEKALALHESLNERSGVARLTGNIATLYNNLQLYDKALENYQHALSMHEDLGEQAGAAIVMGCIGGTYSQMGAHEKALEHYGKALLEAQRLGLNASVSTMMGNIGISHKHLGSYSMALDYYKKALAIHTEQDEKKMIARVTGNIGQLFAEIGNENHDASLAEEYLLKSIAMSDEIQDRKSQCENLISLAALYRMNKRWEEADTSFQKFYTLEKQMHAEQARKEVEQLDVRRKIEESERDRQVKLARFQEQEKILHNILPSSIADRMVAGEMTIAESFNDVSIFFSDIVGFTKLSEKISAEELVQTLNAVFSEMDSLARKHGLEKIKTIGDAYMAVCGVPLPNEHHAESVALFALEVHSVIQKFTTSAGEPINIRIGLHCGSVVAGIIGENKFAYDLWGDAVNIASRMESHGEPGRIHVSDTFCNHLQNRMDADVETQSIASPHIASPHIASLRGLRFTARDEIEIKGKGLMRTYFLQQSES